MSKTFAWYFVQPNYSRENLHKIEAEIPILNKDALLKAITTKDEHVIKIFKNVGKTRIKQISSLVFLKLFQKDAFWKVLFEFFYCVFLRTSNKPIIT